MQLRTPPAHALLLTLVAAGAPAPARAQNVNEIAIYDGTTERSGRLPRVEMRVLQAFPSYLLSGADRLVGMTHSLGDQDLATLEDYYLEVFPDDGSGLPDLSHPLVVEGPFTFDPGPTSGGFGTNLSHEFSTAVEVPCGETIFLSVRLPANASWPNDGLHVGWSGQLGTSPHREAPRGGLSNLVSTIDLAFVESEGVVQEIGNERLWRIYARIEGPTLQAFSEVPELPGLTNPLAGRPMDFGQAGLYPDTWDSEGVGRFDRVGWRMRSVADAGSGAIGFLSFASAPWPAPGGPCPSGGGAGYLALDPNDPLFGLLSATTIADGAGNFVFGPVAVDPGTGALMNLVGFELFAQGAILRANGTVDFSNIARTNF